MKTSRILAVAALALSLAGCGTTEGLVAVVGVASGIITSMMESPDYAKYAEQCKEIIKEARKAADTENAILVEAAKTEASSVLLYMALRKPEGSKSPFTQCALAVPKSFLTQLAESGNLLNFVATVYGINRDSQNSRRSLDANKEISLATLQQQREMQELQNQLLMQLSRNTLDAVNTLKPVTQPVVTP